MSRAFNGWSCQTCGDDIFDLKAGVVYCTACRKPVTTLLPTARRKPEPGDISEKHLQNVRLFFGNQRLDFTRFNLQIWEGLVQAGVVPESVVTGEED